MTTILSRKSIQLKTLCRKKNIHILDMHGGYTWWRNWWWVGCCCTPPLCQFVSNLEHQIRGRCLRKLVILSVDVIVHTWIIYREIIVISFSWCCSWVLVLVTEIHIFQVDWFLASHLNTNCMDVCQLTLNPKPLPIQKVRLPKGMSLGQVRDEDGPLKCPYGRLKTTPRKDPYGRLKTIPRSFPTSLAIVIMF